jgi:hypothetical protein
MRVRAEVVTGGPSCCDKIRVDKISTKKFNMNKVVKLFPIGGWRRQKKHLMYFYGKKNKKSLWRKFWFTSIEEAGILFQIFLFKKFEIISIFSCLVISMLEWAWSTSAVRRHCSTSDHPGASFKEMTSPHITYVVKTYQTKFFHTCSTDVFLITMIHCLSVLVLFLGNAFRRGGF